MPKREFLSRFRGFSTPFGGVAFQPREADAVIARRVVIFLEDRRVLFAPFACEVPTHSTEAVLQIRRFLTDQLSQPMGNFIASNIRSIRAACLKFLVQTGPPTNTYAFDGGHQYTWTFNMALGELRGVIGQLIGILAETYDIDLRPELQAILPMQIEQDPDDTDERDWFWNRFAH